jgi:hypothetical protein
MIRKQYMEQQRSTFYWVENILAANKDYYLTKEEIYALVPCDEDGTSYVTISGLENALRNLAKMECINVGYHLGRKYYNYREGRERYD